MTTKFLNEIINPEIKFIVKRIAAHKAAVLCAAIHIMRTSFQAQNLIQHPTCTFTIKTVPH